MSRAEGGRRMLVIVPTYNERDNLPRKIPQILAQDPCIDVLVVYDNRTTGWVRDLAPTYQRIGDRVLIDPTTTVGELGTPSR